MFENTSKVLYISLHRYDYGDFFPKSLDGDFKAIGTGRGKGFNVNIPWNKSKMGDIEYITAFQRIIMPIAYEYNPELVLVSAGFDAAIGDPIGHYNVTPEAFGYFTHWLSTLANGKIILCLEGGYNVNTISHAMAMCTKALLGDPLPILQIYNQKPNASCIETIQKVLQVQEKYWKSLKFNKKLPETMSDSSVEQITIGFEKLQCEDSPSDSTKVEEENNSQNAPVSDEPQPGPSTSTPSEIMGQKMSLLEFLTNQEGYAIYPRKTCPHLSELNSELAPNCKYSTVNQFPM